MEKGKLFIVSTPIGNLSDITRRAAQVLSEADVVAAEDTRHTMRLLNSLGVQNTLISLHAHSRKEKYDQLIELLLSGKNIALVSDAGTPLISDPGEELIALAVQNGIGIVPVPGPSAPVAALCVSGLPAGRFVFEGFLPRSGAARREALAAIRNEARTVVVLESPKRLLETLEDFKREFGGERCAAVCRELTKLHEEVVRGTLDEILERFRNREIKGEIVIVLAGAAPQKTDIPTQCIKDKLRECIAAGQTKKDAVMMTADFFHISKNKVYKIMLDN